MQNLKSFECIRILHPVDDRKINSVLVFGTRRQGCPQDDLLGRNIVHREWIAKSQLVLCQGAGLVRTKNIDPGQLFNG